MTGRSIGAGLVLAGVLAACSTQPGVTSEERTASPTAAPTTSSSTTTAPTTSTSTSTSTTTSSTTTSSTTVPVAPANAAVAAFASEPVLADIAGLADAPAISCGSFGGAATILETDTDWRGIDTFELDVRQRTINSVQPSAPGFSSSDVQVDVVNIGGLGTDFSWKPSSPTVTDLGLPPATVEQLDGALDGLDFGPYEYSVSSLGGFSGITNVDVVRGDLVDLFERLALGDPALAEASAADLELLGDDVIAELAGAPIGAFHLFDDAFVTDAPEAFDSLLPNSLGGSPVPAVGAAGIADGLDDDGCVLLELRLTADPTSIDDVLGDLADDPSVDPASVPSGDIVFETLVQAQFDQSRGRIVRAVSRNTATIGLDSNVEIVAVTLVG